MQCGFAERSFRSGHSYCYDNFLIGRYVPVIVGLAYLDIIARSFFKASSNPTDFSAKEEKIVKLLISRVRGSYLVSSSKGLHYQTIEKIPQTFPTEEQPIGHKIS